MKVLFRSFSTCVTFLWCSQQVLQVAVTEKYEKCYKRYERKEHKNKDLPKTCAKKLNILYFSYPPYIYFDREHKNVTGILPGIIKQAAETCCNGQTNITYSSQTGTDTQTFFTEMERRDSNFSVMPIITTSEDTKRLYEKPYIKLMEVPGVTFVTAKTHSPLEKITSQLFESIQLTWPLLVISLVICVVAGIIVWFLDTWFNKRDFPHNFAIGTYEGFWWAFISMTTVGYGDKTPRSPLARIFAVIWILFGISMIGMFTATITAALSKGITEEQPTIQGKTVAVLSSANYEASIVYKQGGTPKSYKDISAIKEGLKKKEVEGVVMDNFVLQYHWKELKNFKTDKNNRLKVGETVEVPSWSYSILIAEDEHENSTLSWSAFLGAFFKTNEESREIMIAKPKQWMKHKLDSSVFKSSEPTNVFNIDVSSTNFLNALKYAGIALLCFIIIGIALELTRLWMKRKKMRDGADREAMLEPDFESRWGKIEESIKADLDNLCKAWKEQVWQEWKDAAAENSNSQMSLKEKIKMKALHS